MDFLNFTADENDKGRRLDRIVRRLMPNHSLGTIYKYLRKGLVQQNKSRAKPDSRVQTGDTINIASFLLQDPCQPSLNQQLTVSIEINLGANLFRNSHIWVINKPYDIPVHGGGRSPVSLDKLIVQEYLRQQQKNNLPSSLSFRPGPLHRLDRKTTGILAFSQSLLGAQWFSRALQDRLIGKEYLALVEGKLTQQQHWKEEILRPQKNGGGFHKSVVAQDGKKADTLALPLGWGKLQGMDITLLKIVITTGRTHQIRLHCFHHGFPLLGDTAYGARAVRHLSHVTVPVQQDFFLHAWRLTIPQDNPLELPTAVEAPLPDNFRNILATYLPEMDLKE